MVPERDLTDGVRRWGSFRYARFCAVSDIARQTWAETPSSGYWHFRYRNVPGA
jgi:hypothetical protein